MNSLVIGGSLLAAFLGGGFALLAPCCITFLLPAYFASAFRQRTALLRVTFVFAAGIALVLVPIALGLAALSQLFSRFHRELGIVGGAFLVVLGILAWSGRGLRLPMPGTPSLKRQDALSIIGLGMYSGVASSCCTPVLAGVLALTVLSPSLVHSVALSLAYVAGMVFPMLVLAYFWDERGWANSRLLQGKRVRLRVGRWTLVAHSTNLATGAIFIVMGVVVGAFGLSGGSIYAPQWQVELGTFLNRIIQMALARLNPTAQALAGAAALLLVGLLAVKAFGRVRQGREMPARGTSSAPEASER